MSVHARTTHGNTRGRSDGAGVAFPAAGDATDSASVLEGSCSAFMTAQLGSNGRRIIYPAARAGAKFGASVPDHDDVVAVAPEGELHARVAVGRELCDRAVCRRFDGRRLGAGRQ